MITYLEFGGKELAKRLIVNVIETFGRSNERLISTLTGLPLDITIQLLDELERENCVYHLKLGSLKLWRVL